MERDVEVERVARKVRVGDGDVDRVARERRVDLGTRRRNGEGTVRRPTLNAARVRPRTRREGDVDVAERE